MQPKYKCTQSSDLVFRLEDGASIPRGHPWWDDYEAWVAKGNTPEPADPIPMAMPVAVTRFQAKAALLQAGLLDQVEAMMAAPATDALTKLAWTEAVTFERHSAFILSAAAALNLSDAQLDALFIAAAQVA